MKTETAPVWADVKAFTGGQVKDAEAGIVTAVFSTFGVLDHDRDIVEPGAIKAGPVRVSAYGHGSWGRMGPALLPVGRGVIGADEEKAWAEMQFFMDTTHGRDTFHTVKGMGELQEWSYSLRNVQAEFGEIDGEPVRYIKAVDVNEVSPVLVGASIGTHTVAVKGQMPFREHIDAVMADVIELNERAQQVVALRAEKGKAISEASLEQLELLQGQLKALHELLMVGPAGQDPADVAEAVRREYLRFLSINR